MIIFKITIEEIAPRTLRIYAHGGSVAFPHGEATPFEIDAAERMWRKINEAKEESHKAGDKIVQIEPNISIARVFPPEGRN